MFGFGIGGRLVVLAVVNGGIRMRRDHDLRDMILRLGDVELRAIFIVEVGHVLIGNGDFCDHFAV